MQKIAAEMNLSETVFLRNKEKNGSFAKGKTDAKLIIVRYLIHIDIHTKGKIYAHLHIVL